MELYAPRRSSREIDTYGSKKTHMCQKNKKIFKNKILSKKY
jgi:hypothetical protein